MHKPMPVWARVKAHAQLMRPANMITSAADVLAGYAAAGLPASASLAWLSGATLALYGGGVVFNDFFDRHLDAVERPERPIPSGRATPANAAILGAILLAAGIAAAFAAARASGMVALLIATAALFYDAIAKPHSWLGPLIMGICRGLNLLLGLSANPAMLAGRGFLALISITYVAAITILARGEVHPAARAHLLVSLGLFAAVGAALLALAAAPDFHFLLMLPFFALLAWRIAPALWRAYRSPEPLRVRAAVRTAVLSLVVLDSALAAGFGGLVYGAAVLALLLPAAWLARIFAVS